MSAQRYPFGTDHALLFDQNGQPDVDTTFAVQTDERLILLWDLYKIVTTPSGTLWWAPTSTEDAAQVQADAISSERLTAYRNRLQSAIEQDARYSSVSVFTQKTGLQLRVIIQATAAGRTLVLKLITNDDGTLSVEEQSADGLVF